MTGYAEIWDCIHDSENNPVKASDFGFMYNKYLETKTLANMTSVKAACDADRFRNDPVTSGRYQCVAFPSGSSAAFMQTDNWRGEGAADLCAHRKANADVCRFDVITGNSQLETALSTGAIQASDITASIADDFAGNPDASVRLGNEAYPAMFVPWPSKTGKPGSCLWCMS